MAEDYLDQLIGTVTAPEFIDQHKAIQSFEGDKSIHGYAESTAEALSQHLASERPELAPHAAAIRLQVEPILKERARQHILQKMSEEQRDEHSRTSKEYWIERTPVLGLKSGLDTAFKIKDANRRFEQSDATKDDYRTVAGQMAKQQVEDEKGWIGKTTDVATQMPGMVAEWAMGAGPAAAGRAVAGKLALRGLAGKAAGLVGASAGRTATLGAPRVAAEVIGGDGTPAEVGKAVASNFLENMVFEGTGILGSQEGRGFVNKMAVGLGAISANKELQGDLSLRPGGSYVAKLVQGDPKAWKEFATDATVIGGLEGTIHYFDTARKRGYAANMDKAAKDALETSMWKWGEQQEAKENGQWNEWQKNQPPDTQPVPGYPVRPDPSGRMMAGAPAGMTNRQNGATDEGSPGRMSMTREDPLQPSQPNFLMARGPAGETNGRISPEDRRPGRMTMLGGNEHESGAPAETTDRPSLSPDETSGIQAGAKSTAAEDAGLPSTPAGESDRSSLPSTTVEEAAARQRAESAEVGKPGERLAPGGASEPNRDLEGAKVSAEAGTEVGTVSGADIGGGQGPYGITGANSGHEWDIHDKYLAEHPEAEPDEVEAHVRKTIEAEKANGPWVVIADTRHQQGGGGVYSRHATESEAHTEMMRLKQKYHRGEMDFEVAHRPVKSDKSQRQSIEKAVADQLGEGHELKGEEVKVIQPSPAPAEQPQPALAATSEVVQRGGKRVKGVVASKSGQNRLKLLNSYREEASSNKAIQELHARDQENQRLEKSGEPVGNPVPIHDLMEAANLDEREKHLVHESLHEGREFGEIATDDEMLNDKGESLSKGQMKNIEQGAMAKMGMPADMSIYQLQHFGEQPKTLQGEVIRASKRRGGQAMNQPSVSPGELRFTAEETPPQTRKPLTEREKVLKEIGKLGKKWLKEDLTPEERTELNKKQEELHEELIRLGSRSKKASEGGEEYSEIPRSGKKGAEPVAPNAPEKESGKSGDFDPAAFGTDPKDPVVAAIKQFLSEEGGALNTKRVVDWTVGKIVGAYPTMREAMDQLRELGGEMVPRTTRLAQKAGEALARYVGSGDYGRRLGNQLSEHVSGNADKATRVASGGVIVELRLRHIKDYYNQAAHDAAQKATFFRHQAAKLTTQGNLKDAAKATQEAGIAVKAAQMAASDAANVTSVMNTADLNHWMAQPEVQGILDRYEKSVPKAMDENFKKARGLDPIDPIDAPTQHPKYPVNLMALEGSQPPKVTSKAGTAGGKLKNLIMARYPFAEQAKGNAAKYELDINEIISNSMQKGTYNAAKAEAAREAVRWGVGQEVERGTKIPEGWKELEFFKPPEGMPTPAKFKNKVLLLKEPAYWEFRNALNVDKLRGEDTMQKITGGFTKAALVSMLEFAYHTGNIISSIVNPSIGPVSVAKHLAAAIQGTPELQKQVVELARIASMKPHRAETALIGPDSPYNPFVWSSKIINIADTAMRMAHADAFADLVKRGLKPDTETAKRDFINQLGQYHIPAQHFIVNFLRRTGLGPFAVAGTNFTAQGIKSIFGGTSGAAPTWKGEAQSRAEKIIRAAALGYGAAALANYLAWGNVAGDDNTPFGEVKLGEAAGKTVTLPIGRLLSPLQRGLRSTGLKAVIEGQRRGQPGEVVQKHAAEDILHSLLHPAEGPIVQSTMIAATGKNTIGRQVSEPAGPGESEPANRLTAAAWHFNPLAASGKDIYDIASGSKKTDKTVGQALNDMLGPFGLKFHGSPYRGDYYETLKTMEGQRTAAKNKGMAPPQEFEARYRRLKHVEQAMTRLEKAYKASNDDTQKAAIRGRQGAITKTILKGVR